MRLVHPTVEFDAFTDYNSEFEYKDDLTFGSKTYKYSLNNSFYDMGGYVENIDIYALNKLEAKKRIN